MVGTTTGAMAPTSSCSSPTPLPPSAPRCQCHRRQQRLDGVPDRAAGRHVGALIDPRLAPLGHYGGPTRTMALLASSPAVNAAVVTANSPAFDQRGVARPGGAQNDLGAVEGATVAPLTEIYPERELQRGHRELEPVCDERVESRFELHRRTRTAACSSSTASCCCPACRIRQWCCRARAASSGRRAHRSDLRCGQFDDRQETHHRVAPRRRLQ